MDHIHVVEDLRRIPTILVLRSFSLVAKVKLETPLSRSSPL
jgi:hypothetical protein